MKKQIEMNRAMAAQSKEAHDALDLACEYIHFNHKCEDESDCCFGVDCGKCLKERFLKEARND